MSVQLSRSRIWRRVIKTNEYNFLAAAAARLARQRHSLSFDGSGGGASIARIESSSNDLGGLQAAAGGARQRVLTLTEH